MRKNVELMPHSQNLRFSQRRCCRFKSSDILHGVIGQRVTCASQSLQALLGRLTIKKKTPWNFETSRTLYPKTQRNIPEDFKVISCIVSERFIKWCVRPSPCSNSRRAALRMASGRRSSTITDECRDFDVPLRRKKAFPDPHFFSQNPYFCPAIILGTLSVLFCSTLYICLLYKNSAWVPPRGISYLLLIRPLLSISLTTDRM
jgi:hypothetical protein